jgi:uncharacterized protein
MKFWDASAIVPLLVGQPATTLLQALASHDPVVLVWWGTEVECASAIARLERDSVFARHPLRAADALPLAAAFVAAERRPSSLELVTLDDRLAGAARKEGFVLVEA